MNSHGGHRPARVSGGCRCHGGHRLAFTGIDWRGDLAPGTLVLCHLRAQDQHTRDGHRDLGFPGVHGRLLVMVSAARGKGLPACVLYVLVSRNHVDASIRWACPGLCRRFPVRLREPSRGQRHSARQKSPGGRGCSTGHAACPGHEAASESLLTGLTEQGPESPGGALGCRVGGGGRGRS